MVKRIAFFALFLFALFVLAVGITTVQVVANPLISMLGRAATASSRRVSSAPCGVTMRTDSTKSSIWV